MDRTTKLLAAYANDFSYADLPPTVIHEAKRRIIDSFACAVGGV